MPKKPTTLYVLYKSGLKNIPADAAILSFMSPEEEQGFLSSYPGFISARKEMNAVREKARKVYIDLIARIAATPCAGKTLRQSLQLQNIGNPWWYHKSSEKNAEGDRTFNFLLQIFTILYIADRENVDDIVIYGSSLEVAQVLLSKYKTKRIKCISNYWRYHPIRGLLSRLKYLCRTLYFYNALKHNLVLPKLKPEVVFQGFWHWSIQIEGESKRLKDDYFKLLPNHLIDKDIPCAWFLWLDPYFKPGCEGRSLNKILKPAIGQSQLIFVQKFLTFNDILSVIFDFRHLYNYMCYSQLKEFHYLFRESGFDFWPLLESQLLYNFCDATLPHYFLMEIAYRRAFSFYRPRLALTFLELYLSSRAFYQGANLGSPETVKCTMQHTSYNREKTIILADREREFYGKPDNISMPAPDYFFVMGELCKDILIENGFPSERIFLTGSARYDHVMITEGNSREGNELKVLLVVTRKSDFEMVEAVILAAKDLNLKLYLRKHPLIRIKDLPLYKYYNKIIISSTQALDDELKSTDLLLFTYSTIAEEAFLKGIPVIQWQTAGFNGSVFRDLQIIPSVYSVENLKKILQTFLVNPFLFKPTRESQESILYKCFYKADGLASYRIAEKTIEILQQNRLTEKRLRNNES